MEQYKIYSYLDDISESYNTPITRVDGLYRNPKEIIRTIEFYSNNQYMSGNRDALGREKPFYNVCNYRVTVAKTATDLDVKDIKFEPDSLKFSVQTMVINRELYKYLKETNFSLTLNEMGLTRPKYGGVLLKKNRVDGKLDIGVVDWTNLDFDPSDVIGGTLVETFYLQPSEVVSKEWDNIDEFLKAHNKMHKNKPVKCEVKEVSGEFPEEFDPNWNGKNTETGKYHRMCFYIGVVGKKKFLLYFEYEKENRYKYLPWEAVGKGLGRGIVEDGFEAQVWQNDAMISMKNAMELSGKVIMATDSQKISGNAITGIDNGHIFQMEAGRSLTSVNLSASNLPEFSNIITLWENQYNKIASTYDANTGEAPTAGTPYSQTALLNQVANSPFEYRREEWGIFLNEVLNDWIFPELKKRITKAHTLVADFDDEELDLIDESIAASKTNDFVKEKMLGEGIDQMEQMQMFNEIKDELKKKGKKREIIIPENWLDVKGKITANITGELKNKSAILQSLDSIFKTVVSTFNPQTGQYAALQDPTLAKVFGQIVEMSGVPFSASQLRGGQTTPVAQPDMSAISKPQPVMA